MVSMIEGYGKPVNGCLWDVVWAVGDPSSRRVLLIVTSTVIETVPFSVVIYMFAGRMAEYKKRSFKRLHPFFELHRFRLSLRDLLAIFFLAFWRVASR